MHQMEEDAKAKERERQEQEKRDADSRARAAGKAYWEMRNAAAQNRRRAEHDVPTPSPTPTPDDARPGKHHDCERRERRPAPTPEELAQQQRNAFLDMKREAARNKARLIDAGGPIKKPADGGGHAANGNRAESPRSNPCSPCSPQTPSTPSRQKSATPTAEERRSAYMEMREQARRNKQRFEEELAGPSPSPSPSPSNQEAKEKEREAAAAAQKQEDADLDTFVNDEAQGEMRDNDEWLGDYKVLIFKDLFKGLRGGIKYARNRYYTTGHGAPH